MGKGARTPILKWLFFIINSSLCGLVVRDGIRPSDGLQRAIDDLHNLT